MADKYNIIQMMTGPEAMESKNYIPLTVGALKKWLQDLPDDVMIEIMPKVLGCNTDNCMVPMAAAYINKTELVKVFVLTKREEMDDEGNI